MTWLVDHCYQVQNFLTDSEFYAQPLREVLHIAQPLQSIEDCEAAYGKVVGYVKSKTNSPEDREHLLYCFSLLVASYLIHQGLFTHELRIDDNGDGAFCEIILVRKVEGVVTKDLIIAAVVQVLLSRSKYSFRDFYWSITGMQPEDIL